MTKCENCHFFHKIKAFDLAVEPQSLPRQAHLALVDIMVSRRTKDHYPDSMLYA